MKPWEKAAAPADGATTDANDKAATEVSSVLPNYSIDPQFPPPPQEDGDGNYDGTSRESDDGN